MRVSGIYATPIKQLLYMYMHTAIFHYGVRSSAANANRLLSHYINNISSIKV